MRRLLKHIYYATSTVVLAYFSAYFSYILYQSTLTRSISFTIDTLYLEWNTTFPAITVCEIYNSEKIWELSETYNGADRDTRTDDLLADVAFFNGNCNSCRLCNSEASAADVRERKSQRPKRSDNMFGPEADYGDDTDSVDVDEEFDETGYAVASDGAGNMAGDAGGVIVDCPTNFTDILNKYRTKCSAMLFNCTWNGRPLECCEAFLPVATEFGVCFAINSMHTDPPFAGQPLVANRQSGPGRLIFTAMEDITIHLHAPHDVPYTVDGDIKETVLYGSAKEIVVSLIEMTNEAAVAAVALHHRMCRFLGELANGGVDALYKVYSHSTCTVECSRRAQLRLCNCTHHLMPRHRRDGNATCDLFGLMCLTTSFNTLVEERQKCECLPSCEEPEYNSIFTSAERFREDAGSLVTISMIDLPKQRHRRTLAKSNLDLIISIGGLCGLFFGLSLISTIEMAIKIMLLVRLSSTKRWYSQII